MNNQVPIEWLPVETLSEIFLYCLPETHPPRPILSDAPVILCRVCRLWRDLALSTPDLWCSLFLDQKYFQKYGSKPLELWMVRSHMVPFTFWMDFYSNCIYETIHQATETLITRMHRWKEIVFISDSKYSFDPILAPMIRHLIKEIPFSLKCLRFCYQTEHNQAVDSSNPMHNYNSEAITSRRVYFDQFARTEKIYSCNISFLELCTSASFVPPRLLRIMPSLLRLKVRTESVEKETIKI